MKLGKSMKNAVLEGRNVDFNFSFVINQTQHLGKGKFKFVTLRKLTCKMKVYKTRQSFAI